MKDGTRNLQTVEYYKSWEPSSSSFEFELALALRGILKCTLEKKNAIQLLIFDSSLVQSRLQCIVEIRRGDPQAILLPSYFLSCINKKYIIKVVTLLPWHLPCLLSCWKWEGSLLIKCSSPKSINGMSSIAHKDKNYFYMIVIMCHIYKILSGCSLYGRIMTIWLENTIYGHEIIRYSCSIKSDIINKDTFICIFMKVCWLSNH